MSGLGFHFARLARQMNSSRKFISEKHVKVISPGGFPYESFNAKAQISPWSMLRLLEFSRNATFIRFTPNGHCFLDLDEIYRNRLMFASCTTTNISPELYDFSVCKSPLEIHMELANVGKTSFGLKSTICLIDRGPALCENFTQIVFIDLNSRKPSPPPEWWLEKYTQGLEKKASPRLARHVVPESGILSRYQVKIAAADLDFFYHTNWSNYLKFSYNAFIDFAVSKHGLENVSGAFRRSKDYSLLFLQEANLNDILDIHLWRDPENANMFKFQFFKKSDIICESHIHFYPHDQEEL